MGRWQAAATSDDVILAIVRNFESSAIYHIFDKIKTKYITTEKITIPIIFRTFFPFFSFAAVVLVVFSFSTFLD